VLKQDGVLSFRGYHIKEDDIISKLAKRGLFTLLRKEKRTYSLAKKEA
jgi:hypothetical protein